MVETNVTRREEVTLTESCNPQNGGYDDGTIAAPHDPTTVRLERAK